MPAACQPVVPPTSVSVPGADRVYRGPLFDAHLHLNWPGALSLFPSAEALCSLLGKNGVSWALSFYPLSPLARPAAAPAAPVANGARDRVIPLVAPGPFFIQGQWTETALRSNLRPAWVMEGFGEIAWYRPEYQGATFDGQLMQAVLRAVGAMNGVVMVHPTGDPIGRRMSLEEIEPAVRAYPNIVFLFHGGPRTFDDLVRPLASRYPNVYMSWDVGPWVFAGGPWGGNLLEPDPQGSGSAESFVAAVHQIGRERILANALQKSLPRIGSAPDRVLWGTDLGLPWHFEEPARSLIMEMARQFIGRLPAEVQEAYAFRNAHRVFSRYLPAP